MPEQRRRQGRDAVFAEHRPTLLGVAYRMLGSVADAEDVVQEAWLRWDGAADAEVEAPRRYLITVVSRLAIDWMRSVSRRRERYVGPWLPEPVQAAVTALEPAETAAERDTLSLAALRLMEQLSPPERAVFVLREAFELPFSEIGEVLGLSGTNARQLHHRGRRRLGEGRGRFDADPVTHRVLVERFLDAARTGDRQSLQSMLAEDVTVWTDGGGNVRAALKPVCGAHRVARLVLGALAKHPDREFRTDEVNGAACLVLRIGERWHVCTLEVGTDGLVTGIQWMSNPDKLERLVPIG